ncbi:SctK family type III secretion system sorting platform protein [Morganella psychrotolerans]|uniref:SctK family type III secretion system sorting platform protein n=1 Tax=Morganella psychrotolerans TaxID=368603 RepID=UPI0039B02708
MSALTDFQFRFCPVVYCHPDHLNTLTQYQQFATLPDKYTQPRLNKLLFDSFSLTADADELTTLQQAILLSNTELQRFLTFCGSCFYLRDLTTRWPVPGLRRPFIALTTQDTALLLRWKSGLLLPLQHYQRSLTDTPDDESIIHVTGQQLWFYLIQESSLQFRRRAELRFPVTVSPPVHFPDELTPLLNTLCLTILRSLTQPACHSAV